MTAARRTRRVPLAGVRIVSLAQNLPGPLALARLVALGATAVKIEPPGGDPLAAFSRAWYRQLHRRVKVQRIDLQATAGRGRLAALLASADVLLTSQRPSALARLGLTTRMLARRHPHLRWLNIVGDTRDPDRPGHDLTYQAAAGLVGAEMPRTLLADLLGAEHATSAVLALLRVEGPRAHSVGLRDALGTAVTPAALGLTAPAGVLGGGLPTYRVYRTRAGRVAVAALEPHFRARLYEALGLPIGADLTRAMRRRTARDWERWAGERDLPMVRVVEWPARVSGPRPSRS